MAFAWQQDFLFDFLQHVVDHNGRLDPADVQRYEDALKQRREEAAGTLSTPSILQSRRKRFAHCTRPGATAPDSCLPTTATHYTTATHHHSA